jgi:hypothetical protein
MSDALRPRQFHAYGDGCKDTITVVIAGLDQA